MTPPTIILASASPRRTELLRAMGLTFAVTPAAGVEELLAGAPPPDLAQINAERKAVAVAARAPDALVIGADTLVVLGDRVYGKPADLAGAESMLAELVGRRHEVITGVCVQWRARHAGCRFFETTAVWMRPLDPARIREYLGKIQPLDKAGSYAVQEHGAGIIERIEGSYTNVMGLPAEKLTAHLRAMGVDVPDAAAHLPRFG